MEPVTREFKIDFDDLKWRWESARLSAIRSVLAPELIPQTARPYGAASFPELELLKSVAPESRDKLLRAVFDASRKLGLSFARFHRISLEISDLAELMPKMGSFCFQGNWKTHNSAQVLERQGCTALKELGSLGCDYWREALDGFVMGAGENERLARHRSQGHGDSECVDVLFTEEVAPPRVISSQEANCNPTPSTKIKYGPVPTEIQEGLVPARARLGAMRVKLQIEGLSEGNLYYRLDAEEGVLCGAGGKLLHDSLAREVQGLFPKLQLKDCSPLAVYGGST
jgi:hypothetical protein